MRSFTHYLVDALLSLSTRASQRRAHLPNRRPALLNLLLLACMLTAVSAHAQYTFAPVGTIGNLSTFSVLVQGGYSAPTLVDLNGDGKLDIVTGAQNGTFFYYQNNGTAVSMPATPGTASWTSAVVNPFSGFDVGFRSAPAFVDIDGDLDMDMFSGNSVGEFKYFENVGTPTAPMFTERFYEDNPLWFEDPSNPGVYLPHNVGAVSSIGFLDADAIPDGDLDIVASNSQGQFFYFENDGDMFTPYFPIKDSGAPRAQSLRASPQVLQGSGNSILNATVCIVDMNCDHLSDVLSGTRNGTFQFRALETTGANGYDHRFNSIMSTVAPLYTSDVSSSTSDYSYPAGGDLDGDGDVDFISGRFNGTFVYFQNTTCNTAPTFAFGTGGGCGSTYNVTLDNTGNYTILPADIGTPSANANGCFAATVDYSLSAVDCDDLPTLIPVTIKARNTTTGVKSATSCIVYVDVIDNIIPALPAPNMGTCNLTQPFYVNLDANGTASMGTVAANAVPNDFTDNCNLTYTVLNQPPAAFQFNCASITAPPFPTPPNNTPYQIVLQASDESGNTATCIANIIIRDVTPPAVTPATLPNVPLSICTSQMGTASFNQPAFTATDNCGTVTATATISPMTGVTQTGVYPNISWSFAAAGTFTITYTFSDNASPANTITRSQTVIVANAPLYFNPACPPNQTVTVNPTTGCSAAVTWTAPVGLDCSTGTAAGVNTFGTRASGYVFPVGTETVVYTATKGANSIQCYFTVTVQDNVAPVVGSWTTNALRTAPTSGTFSNGSNYNFNMGNSCGVLINWTAPASSNVTDNCAPPNTTPTRRERFEFDAPGAPIAFVPVTGAAGSTFLAGTTRVIYDYVDAAGNVSASTYYFDLTVIDNTFPSITCPSPITTIASQGLCYADVYLPKPSGNQVSDNCVLPLNAITGPAYGPPSQNFPLGSDYWRFEIGMTNPVNFTVTDASGNTSTCTMTVTVRDNQKPVFSNCITTDVPLSAGASCTIAQTLIHPTVTDNAVLCTIPGTLTYTLTISGATTLAATAVTSGGMMPVTFNEGVSTVLYTATDPSGNIETCSYKVKVTNTIPPSFTNCPSFQGSIGNLPTDAGNCYYTLAANSFAAQLGAFGGGMGCDPGTFSFTRLPNTPLALGSPLNVGVHVLKVVATDYSGNTASCQFSVTIQDLIVPTTTSTICGSTLNFNTDLNQCTTVPTWNAPIFTDNCGIQTTTTTYVNPPSMTPVNYIAGSSLSKGTYIFTYTARDAANNPGFCTFTVNVVDAQKPSFTNCPVGTQFVDVSAPAACAGTYTLTLNATDNCTGTVSVTPSTTVSVTVDLDPSLTYPSTSTATYIATDVAGNTMSCVITVQARDVSGPVVTGCPTSTTLTIGSPVVCVLPHPSGWADPTMFADCTLPVTQVGGPAPTIISQNQTPVTVTGTAANRNAMFPTGVNTVTYTYKDGATPANTSTCTFTVTVIEGVPPVFATCPSPITVSTDANSCTLTPTSAFLLALPPAQHPTATDLCSPSVTYGVTGFPVTAITAPGTFTVNWTAMDNSGNINSTGCVQTIRVRDLTAPVITCGAPYTITTLPNNNCVENNNTFYPIILNAAFSPALPTATDNCTLSGFAISREPGQPGQYCVGTNTLFWRVTDGNGNTASCAQQITVIANTSCTPSLTALAATSGQSVNLSDISGVTFTPVSCCTTPTFVSAQLTAGPVAAGPYPVAVVNPASYTFTTAGSYTVEYTISCSNFKNPSGGAESTMTFSRTVNVSPSTPTPCTPSYTCPPANPPVRLTSPANNCQYNITSDVPAVTVTCNGTTTVQPSTTGNKTAGTYTVTYTYNSNTICTVNIQVQNPATEIPNNGIDDNCNGQTDENNPTPPQNGCWDELVSITANDAAAGKRYGVSISIDGDYAVVGANQDNSNRGAVYILHQQGGTWVEVKKITLGASATTSDYFGESVAISGNDIIVGARRKASLKGAAYIFSKDQGGVNQWGLMATLAPASLPTGAEFGYSVDIDGIYAIVGARRDKNGSVITGSAYMFKRTGSVWGQLGGPRFATGGAGSDYFGCSVSLSVPYAVVGAYGVGTGDQGRAYLLYQGVSEAWTQVGNPVLPAGLDVTARLGFSVAIDGAMFIVGANNQLNAFGDASGAAYIFQLEPAPMYWSEVQKIEPSNGNAGDLFGSTVSIYGDYAAVGSGNPTVTASGSSETVYVYLNDGSNNWSAEQIITDINGTGGDYFGIDVAIDDATLAVGSFRDNVGANTGQGTAHFYNVCPTTIFAPQNNADSRNKTYPVAANGTVRCFPNPFSDVLNIELSMEQEENVTVTVCDASGREIAVVFNDKTNGISNLQWSSQGFADGMYFVRVTSPTMRKVMPVVVLRERP